MIIANLELRKRSLRGGAGLLLLSYLLMWVHAQVLALVATSPFSLPFSSSSYVPQVAVLTAGVSAVLSLLAWGRKADKIGLMSFLFAVWAVLTACSIGLLLMVSSW